MIGPETMGTVVEQKRYLPGIRKLLLVITDVECSALNQRQSSLLHDTLAGTGVAFQEMLAGQNVMLIDVQCEIMVKMMSEIISIDIFTKGYDF